MYPLKPFSDQELENINKISGGKAEVLNVFPSEVYQRGGKEIFSGKEAFAMDGDYFRYEKKIPTRAIIFYTITLIEVEGEEDIWYSADKKYNGNFILLNAVKGLEERFIKINLK